MFCTVRKSSINGVSSCKLGSQKKKRREKALIFTLADFHGVSASTIADFKVSSDVTKPAGILRPERVYSAGPPKGINYSFYPTEWMPNASPKSVRFKTAVHNKCMSKIK